MQELTNKLMGLNNHINKLFKNPQINFLIIMILVLFITCYSLLSESLKQSISYILSNPITTILSIAFIIIIGCYDISIASLMLILFFIILYGWTNTKLSSNLFHEGFENQDNNQILDEQENKINKHVAKITNSTQRTKNNLKIKAENDKNTEDKVNSIKEIVMGTINKYRQSNDNDYKNALLENKKAMFKEEYDNNHSIVTSNKQNKKNSRGHRKRENFQTVEPRALDPSNEDDTNLLITKEILQDMINRIEYNYETNKYLRKYIKHRIEEIIDLNKFAEDD